ncbi:hypothetical protein GCM10018780_24570 [Streptomyces lanatus]|nr:hypothetical protein GCM10018780_24570 [Streptomyces lanatus]
MFDTLFTTVARPLDAPVRAQRARGVHVGAVDLQRGVEAGAGQTLEGTSLSIPNRAIIRNS